MLQRSLRLRAPEPRGRHLDRAERVLLGAGLAHLDRIHLPKKGKFHSMTRHQRFLALAALGVAAFAVHAQSPKPEDQIKLRKAAYDMMGFSFGGINAMAEGKRPYDKDEATRLADLLAQVSMVPRRFFGEGTDKGETRAKPEIWT